MAVASSQLLTVSCVSSNLWPWHGCNISHVRSRQAIRCHWLADWVTYLRRLELVKSATVIRKDQVGRGDFFTFYRAGKVTNTNQAVSWLVWGNLIAIKKRRNDNVIISSEIWMGFTFLCGSLLVDTLQEIWEVRKLHKIINTYTVLILNMHRIVLLAIV